MTDTLTITRTDLTGAELVATATGLALIGWVDDQPATGQIPVADERAAWNLLDDAGYDTSSSNPNCDEWGFTWTEGALFADLTR